MRSLALAFASTATAAVIRDLPSTFERSGEAAHCYDVRLSTAEPLTEEDVQDAWDTHFKHGGAHDSFMNETISNIMEPHYEPLSYYHTIAIGGKDPDGPDEAEMFDFHVPHPEQQPIPLFCLMQDEEITTHIDLAGLKPSWMKPDDIGCAWDGVLKGPYYYQSGDQSMREYYELPRYMASYSISSMVPVEDNGARYKLCTTVFSGYFCSARQLRPGDVACSLRWPDDD